MRRVNTAQMRPRHARRRRRAVVVETTYLSLSLLFLLDRVFYKTPPTVRRKALSSSGFFSANRFPLIDYFNLSQFDLSPNRITRSSSTTRFDGLDQVISPPLTMAEPTYTTMRTIGLIGDVASFAGGVAHAIQ